MRLINADKIKLPQGFFEKVDNVPKFYKWLDKQPTVDAVEVVRCKDCKYTTVDNDVVRRNCGLHLVVNLNDNDFCSRGVRKE